MVAEVMEKSREPEPQEASYDQQRLTDNGRIKSRDQGKSIP